jgi:hypothetical protein
MPAAAPAPAPPLDPASIKRGLLAGLLAWLLPGAGHFYLGARRRAVVFFAVLVVTLSLGIAFDGNLAVVDPRTPWLSKLQVGANLGLGPWEPLLRRSIYGQAVYASAPGPARLGLEAEQALRKRREREMGTWSAYGSIYLLTACLMNLLLVLDAWDIAIRRKG